MTDFTLRQWEYTDAVSIAQVADNPKIAQYLRNAFPNPYTIGDARWYVKECIEVNDRGQITRAIVIDGKAVGSIGVFLQRDVYEKSAELGYWLAEEYWGQGIISSAVRTICEQAFATFDINRIYAEPFEHNIASRKVLEKIGFTLEGIMRNGVYKNDEVHSYCMYSLLRGELK